MIALGAIVAADECDGSSCCLSPRRAPEILLQNASLAALPPRVKVALYSVLGVATGQVTLGIAALVNYVPVELGVAHQAGALSLWTVRFWRLHHIEDVLSLEHVFLGNVFLEI